MKQAPRGPFNRIRWFCADGEILPPKPHACLPHGGGVQHGEWTDQVKQLRTNGYYVANILAGIDVHAFLQSPNAKTILNQILIEQFLIQLDDGWIWRKARFYRGALQEEGERDGARRLLTGLLAEPEWLSRNFIALRTGANLLRHGTETLSASQVRERSSELANLDPGFKPLRNKIHVLPEAEDADRVRDYARGLGHAADARYTELADLIDRLYADHQVEEQLLRLASGNPMIVKLARTGSARLQAAGTPQARFAASADLLAEIRRLISEPISPSLRLAMLDVSLALEASHFTAATELRGLMDSAPRRQQLDWLHSAVQASYGTGLISQRQREALDESMARLDGSRIDLHTYQTELNYLSLVTDWSQRQLDFSFGASMRHLADIEPKAGLFIHSQLRASALLFFAQVLDGLLQDANQLAGVRKELFSAEIGSGLRGLNPGLAQGILHTSGIEQDHTPDPRGIYLLSETRSQLFPVAGILTAGAGNRLSHVQLLARNLGIPNVAVDKALIPRLREADGKQVQLAVSASGSVRLVESDNIPSRAVKLEVLIHPDLEKLNLDRQKFLTLSELKADDSGRVVGPKAAKLARLQQQLPEAVADGLVIPFGVFRHLLDQPFEDSGRSVFEWMKSEYRRLAALPAGSRKQNEGIESFRGQLHEWIIHADPGDGFRKELGRAMRRVFGPDGSYGVFVRSDTNVEDLPGFTGAGLNLTVPNVVGFEQVQTAISQVWASPFTARAFAWRQARMDQPEHVYPAILLMRSVPVDKSGVMVTQDIDNGDRRWLSVAVNEGVGGAVDGQASESLRIGLDTGEIRFMAQATATHRRIIEASGGIRKLPVSGTDRVLSEREIEQLVGLAQRLEQRLPATLDDTGLPVAADIEFGFLHGELKLFQIRPFLESRRARTSQTLIDLDAGIKDLHLVRVGLGLPPGGEL
ncbi:MAG: PEP/pyruvate-binding domain-containing protein [Pseudomonadota bacterium]